MPKPVCVKCKRFFKPACNGVRVLEQMPDSTDARPGTEEEEKWRPYKLWRADLLRCAGCGTEIVAGFGMGPYSEHYKPDFEVPPFAITVNDC